MRAGFEVRRGKPLQCLRATVAPHRPGKICIFNTNRLNVAETPHHNLHWVPNKEDKRHESDLERQAGALRLGAVQEDNPPLLS